MHNQSDDAANGVWMTYRQLAAVRGIGQPAAVRLVQRRKWPKREGSNDGLAHVCVPHDWAKPGDRDTGGARRRGGTSPPDVAAAFKVALDAICQQQAHERVSWGEERDRLIAELEQVRLAENTRRALGRWERLRRAWRGE